jgi:hypothetical protein
VRWFGHRSAHDVGLDHDVGSTTNQHKMFDIVTADEDDTSFSVELDGFDYSYPSWCVAAAQPIEHVFFPLRDAGQRFHLLPDFPMLPPNVQ